VQRNSGRLVIADEGDGEDDSGEWIMSYADTVTLLLCFFIIFFAEFKKQSEKDLFLDLSKNLTQSDDESDAGRKRAETLSEIESEVRSELAQFEVKNVKLGIERRRREILVRLYERDFFHVGSFLLKENGKNVLESVSKLLIPHQEKILLRVEGHSDSLPVNPLSAYKTNLNLSSLRASQAANVLIADGMIENKIRVVGFGSANRIVEDRMPASEGGDYLPQMGLKNRRIELRIQTLDEKADQIVDARK
jgi:chemotaxis protein MotB